MVERYKSRPPALKHGAYSRSTLLPGEDAAAFDELHDALIADIVPTGPIEDDLVESMARVMWRKQNLAIYQRAERARKRVLAINAELAPPGGLLSMSLDMRNPDEVRAEQQAAKKQAKKELGEDYNLVELGDAVAIDQLLDELSVVDRLDGMIDRYLKRLLFVRGLKSLSSGSSTAPSPPRTKRIAAA